MTDQFLGRHAQKDVFKPGERCQWTGAYRCENCRGAGRNTVVQVQEGAIFPMCETCDDWDMGWRPLSDGAR